MGRTSVARDMDLPLQLAIVIGGELVRPLDPPHIRIDFIWNDFR